MYMCTWVSIFILSANFRLEFGTISTVVLSCFSFYYQKKLDNIEGVIRSRKQKKYRKCHDLKKRRKDLDGQWSNSLLNIQHILLSYFSMDASERVLLIIFGKYCGDLQQIGKILSINFSFTQLPYPFNYLLYDIVPACNLFLHKSYITIKVHHTRHLVQYIYTESFHFTIRSKLNKWWFLVIDRSTK